MKKKLLLFALIAVGCQQAALAPPAKLLGINDMVRVGQYLVVPSTERDELRVLNMVTATQDVRMYVGAPNPLLPLAIPVLQRPTFLAVDTQYINYQLATANGFTTIPLGAEKSGPYVYAGSPGSSEISVVNIGIGVPSPDGGSTAPQGLDGNIVTDGGAAVEQFVEIQRILTSAPVTAMAASTMAGAHTLFYATFDGTTATVWSVNMLGTPDALLMTTPANLENSLTTIFSLPQGESVTSLLVLPPLSGETQIRLALSTRVASGTGGRAFIYDLNSGTISQTLNFPQPVRKIVTHAGTDLSLGTGVAIQNPPGIGPILPPGQRIFGVLDEEVCGNFTCGGILAVDTTTGNVMFDLPGLDAVDAGFAMRQMLPMRFGSNIVTSLALQPGGAMVLPPVAAPGQLAIESALSVLGVATLSNGGIVFFNAGDLFIYDAEDNTTPISVGPSTTGITITDFFGNVVDTDYGPMVDGGVAFDGGGLLLTDGKALDENINVIYEGVLPGLLQRPVAGTFINGGGSEGNAVVGDIVACRTPDDGGIFIGDTENLLTAGSVVAIGDGGLFYLPAGDNCPGATALDIRAAPPAAFVVVGDTSGYMGRAANGDRLEFEGVFTRHPANYPAVVGDPQMLLPFNPLPMSPVPAAETRWTISIDDNYNPTLATMDPAAANCGLPVNLLGQVSINPDLQHIFFAVLSANGIVDLNAASAQRGAIEANMSCWR
jgi:hypothetical protein